VLSSDETIEFSGSVSIAPFNRAMASSAVDEKVHGGAYRSNWRTFDVEIQTGAFEDTVHFAIEYLGASTIVVTGGDASSAAATTSSSSASAKLLNGAKNIVAAATKDVTPAIASRLESRKFSRPSSSFRVIDNRDCGF